ncbi:hypothetical protein [Noviluteimonas gilva]|uniref:Uncharacterized protein n=1 Tax=Noviluteimonas gilva TaxID=2682097 RepID=A0A7C9HMX7_9GAMM|nr:hypothetical protein [Lysobacter gilvus]MUV14596.1 hypothetical protein [Lysobacter gilvus]
MGIGFLRDLLNTPLFGARLPTELAVTTDVLQRFASGDASWKALLRWEFDGRDYGRVRGTP